MDDLISRQAAIDAVRATLLAWSYMPEWRDNKIIEAVKRLPPIQPKRGKWIDKGWTGDWQYLTDGRGDCWRNIVCSECGESVRHESNFCPNCGAKMEVNNEID